MTQPKKYLHIRLLTDHQHPNGLILKGTEGRVVGYGSTLRVPIKDGGEWAVKFFNQPSNIKGSYVRPDEVEILGRID